MLSMGALLYWRLWGRETWDTDSIPWKSLGFWLTLALTSKFKKNRLVSTLPRFQLAHQVHQSPPVQGGLTALLLAACRASLEVVHLLIDRGANIIALDHVS